jgi:integrase
VTVPAGVKARIDAWLSAAGITTGRIFRPVNKRDVIVGTENQGRKGSLRLVMRYAKATDLGQLAPHDLRRTCAKLCRKAGGELEQIQLLVGHASIQTTERYLGTEQALAHAVNDAIGPEMRETITKSHLGSLQNTGHRTLPNFAMPSGCSFGADNVKITRRSLCGGTLPC